MALSVKVYIKFRNILYSMKVGYVYDKFKMFNKTDTKINVIPTTAYIPF